MVKLLEPAAQVALQTLGARDALTVGLRANLAHAYGQTGRLRAEIELLEQLLPQLRELKGDTHADTLTVVEHLALAYMNTGRSSEATPLLQSAVAQRKARFGETHPTTLTSMLYLSNALVLDGQVGDALTLAEQAYQTSLRMQGPLHPDTLTKVPLLSQLYGQTGNVRMQRKLLDDALPEMETVLGPEHPTTLGALQQQLAALTLADHAEERLKLAEQLLQRRRATNGTTSQPALEATREVARAEYALGRRDAARRRLRELAETEAAAFPDAPPMRVQTLMELARVHAGLETPDDYLLWAGRAADMARALYGESHPATLRYEFVRADALHVQRRHQEALDLRRRVLEQQERQLGPGHRDVVASLRGVLTELLMLRRFDEARALTPRLVVAGERLRATPGLPTVDRQIVSAQLANAYRTLAALHGLTREVQTTFTLVEAYKARILLDELAQRRAGGADVLPPSDRERLMAQEAQLAALERQLAGSPPPDALVRLESARNAASSRLADLQRDLGARHPRYAKLSNVRPIRVSELPGVLDADSVFVHFIRSGHGKELFALVYEPNGPWTFAALGEQPDLDDAIEMLRQAHADPGGLRTLPQRGQRAWRDGAGRYRLLAADAPAPPGALAVTDADALSAELGKRLLGPLEARLARYKTWILSPDGALARLPFDLLQLGEQRVLDRATVQIAQSLSVYVQARALQKAARARQPEARLLAFGDPAYTGGSDTAARRSRAALRQDSSLTELSPLWEPLPGTRREVESLARLFPERSEVFLGERASKQQLQALQAQGRLKAFRYVHLATHGYASDSAPALSAVVLSQRNLPPGGDGYVTASEWPAFELGSELTVLSACDTALGPAVAGEGVLGLPYALFVAGSAATVLTLWPVDDAATALLMEDFYRRLVAGTAPAQALAEAKRTLAANPRHAAPRYWAPFVLVGAG
ncbi:MAG: CHAT domain-containing tetratricopeptide repeat protein [Rubrivivax sp.]